MEQTFPQSRSEVTYACTSVSAVLEFEQVTYPANVPELEADFPAELLDVMWHVQILIEICPIVSDNIRRHNTRDAHLEVQDREF